MIVSLTSKGPSGQARSANQSRKRLVFQPWKPVLLPMIGYKLSCSANGKVELEACVIVPRITLSP